MVYALWWQNSYIPGVTKKPTCVWKQTQLFIMVPSSSYGKWNYFARFCRIMMTDPYGTKSLLALAFFIDVCLSKHSKMTGWCHHNVKISDCSKTFKYYEVYTWSHLDKISDRLPQRTTLSGSGINHFSLLEIQWILKCFAMLFQFLFTSRLRYC